MGKNGVGPPPPIIIINVFADLVQWRNKVGEEGEWGRQKIFGRKRQKM